MPTLMDHIKELQTRLFITVAVFLAIAAASFPFFEQIVDLIVKPLGEGQELIYLTPAGAFNFMILVSVYVGIIGALPAIVFHLYRFIMPAVNPFNFRRAVLYTIVSILLAAAGIVFSYIVMLPAAIQFLTGFDFYHINPMLTIESYFSFVMTYIFVGALLFQLPLVMLIINGVTPLKPGGLMKHQSKIIVGSFVVAALVSPTPDALNQCLLASPIIVMYQIGIFLIWIKNRKLNQSDDLPDVALAEDLDDIIARLPRSTPEPTPQPQPTPARPTSLAAMMTEDDKSQPAQEIEIRSHTKSRSMDGMVDGQVASRATVSTRPASASVSVPARPTPVRSVQGLNYRRSIDGIS